MKNAQTPSDKTSPPRKISRKSNPKIKPILKKRGQLSPTKKRVRFRIKKLVTQETSSTNLEESLMSINSLQARAQRRNDKKRRPGEHPYSINIFHEQNIFKNKKKEFEKKFGRRSKSPEFLTNFLSVSPEHKITKFKFEKDLVKEMSSKVEKNDVKENSFIDCDDEKSKERLYVLFQELGKYETIRHEIFSEIFFIIFHDAGFREIAMFREFENILFGKEHKTLA